MDYGNLKSLVAGFPLVGRPRPPCIGLAERVEEVADLAAEAEQHSDSNKSDEDIVTVPPGTNEAASALNKAALLASDCGMPELARELCLRHIDAYQATAYTPPVTIVRYLLEPAFNLARLQIRADDGNAALTIMDTIYKAVLNHTDFSLHSRTLRLSQTPGTPDQRRRLREWIWLQYLGDGIRCLTLAGRWDDAIDHATQLRGIGGHLMEGRQVAILNHLLHRRPARAQELLERSTITQPWEHQIAACLTTLCATQLGNDVTTHLHAAHDLLEQSPTALEYITFRVRLRLIVTGLAYATGTNHLIDETINTTAEDVINTRDGYAAREVLRSPAGEALTERHRNELLDLVHAAGLRAGQLPSDLNQSLMSSIEQAEAALTSRSTEMAKLVPVNDLNGQSETSQRADITQTRQPPHHLG